MNEVADYCLDSEHAFYIEWLKDIKSILWFGYLVYKYLSVSY